MEKFLTLTEVTKFLGIEEAEVVKLAEKGVITAYRIGGNFLRFKLKDIEEYRRKISTPQKNGIITEANLRNLRKDIPESDYSFRERIYDFFYYYDFYLIVTLLITLLLIIIFKF